MTGPVEFALAVRDGKEQPTSVLIRGNAGMPGDKVEPGFLSVLTNSPPVIAKPKQAASSGRRLALARWLTSPDHPLTARVMANRIWKHHFGRGIVATTSDFGHGGTPPTHPQLLDWLAAEFMAGDWSIKRLHKTIMLSDAYQRSSRSDNSAALEADPANELFWRQNLRRLEAESIRDAVLATSGELNPAMGGRGFFPHLAGEVLAGESRPGGGWELSPLAEQHRRSIYAFIKRSMVPPMLEGFDYATTASPLAERPVTTVAPQALILLNDQFIQQQARALAERLEREASQDPAGQVERLYQLALGRRPAKHESDLAQAYLERQTRSYQQIMSRLTFAPDVPLSLHNSYVNRLQAEDYLLGPTSGWSYYKGKWGGGYEGIMTVDRDRGPFALWQGPTFADGAIEGQLTLQNAVEFGTIIFRATAEGDVFRGYEVSYAPRDEEIVLRRHGADVTLLGQVELPIATGQPVPMKIEAVGPRIRVWFGGEKPVLDVTDPQPLQDAGRVGARSWGAAMSVDHWTVTTGGQRLDVATPLSASASVSPQGPLAGWTTFGGKWSVEDSVCSVEPVPGGKAICEEVTLADGTLEADVLLRDPRGDAGIVLRASQATYGVDALHAYNINFQAGGCGWESIKTTGGN